MIPKEIFKKVRQIEITTSRLVSDIFQGEYHSVFKGQGLEFDEVREYQFGDDVRDIDWNVTARTGKAHVKKFVEERELTVMILVDVSKSCQFSSVNVLKSQLAAEITSVLSLSAIKNNDRVGVIIFSDKIEKFIPPRKGTSHVLRIIREILMFKPDNDQTNIIEAVEYLNKVTTRKSIVFLVSDFFLDHSKENRSEYFKKVLAVSNKRHDLIAITLNDPREKELLDCGILTLEDAESGELHFIDSTDKQVRASYKEQNLKRVDARQQMFKSLGVDFIDISTHHSYADEMVRFFLKRRKRR